MKMNETGPDMVPLMKYVVAQHFLMPSLQSSDFVTPFKTSAPVDKYIGPRFVSSLLQQSQV